MWRSLRISSTTASPALVFTSRISTYSASAVGHIRTEKPSDYKDSSARDADDKYPGTAVARMEAIRSRIRSLTQEELSGDWKDVRRWLMWAGGLGETRPFLPDLANTIRCFNDFNHCDVIAVKEHFACPSGDELRLVDNAEPVDPLLGASPAELGTGLSWITCMVGCNETPPADKAHLYFKARVAFKLVWVPPLYQSFVVVDDEGRLLNKGTPRGQLPDYFERSHNYKAVAGSKYAREALAAGCWFMDGA